MDYGLYLSASGVLANTHRQDVFANNLANVQTVGFKPMLADIRARPAEAGEDAVPFAASHKLLDRLGGGVLAEPQGAQFGVGAPQATGRDLDAALTDKDTFFAVADETPDGSLDLRLSRDGRFSFDPDGRLVNSAGWLVLGNDDRPIQLDVAAGPVRIDGEGRLLQNNQEVDAVQVARVADASDQLRPTGRNAFAFLGPDPREPAAAFGLEPGHVETSGANAISTLMQVIGASKSAMGNATMIRYQDTMLDRAINTFGRLA